MTPNQVYADLEARCLPLIEAYHRDLKYHDRLAVTKAAPGIPFLHATNACGTHIIFLFPADHDYWPREGERVKHLFGSIDRHGLLESVQAVAYWLVKSTATQKYLYYDGHRIQEVSAGEFLQIAKDHVRDTVKAWLVDPIMEAAA